MAEPAREERTADPLPDHLQRATGAPQPAATPSERMLALQRAAGNRGARAALARGARARAAPAAVLARRPTQVRTYQTDGPYGIPGAFEVEFDTLECRLTIRANVLKLRGVSDEELERVKTETREAFLRFWDGKFILRDSRTNEDFFLRVDVVFTNRRPHTTIRLRQNRRDPDGNVIEGRDNQTTWFVHSNSNDRAHELSHQLGLKDEYIDAGVRNRRDASAPGVFQDHSLLGNYYDEGIEFAEVKLRHGQELARAIGRATRRRFTVVLSGPFQGERLERWRRIWANTASGSSERTAAEAEIRAIEADMLLPEMSAAAGVTYTPQYAPTGAPAATP